MVHSRSRSVGFYYFLMLFGHKYTIEPKDACFRQCVSTREANAIQMLVPHMILYTSSCFVLITHINETPSLTPRSGRS